MSKTALFLGLFLLWTQAGCRERPLQPAALHWPAMNTLASVSVPAARAERLSALRDEVSGVFAEIERACSAFKEESEVSAVNRNAGGAAVPVSAQVAELLACALRVARESGGAFDPTVGPLMQLWGFRADTVIRPPSQEDLMRVRERMGWEFIEISRLDETTYARLSRPNMRLDLGAIAKGYAVDRAYLSLEREHTDFMVNLGGNLRARGEAAPGRGGWRTGIRNPFDRDALVGTVILTKGEATATSGNYERFVVFEDRRYAHIMDPRTGWPVRGMAGVTVLAPSATLADALSTALFVLGPEAGMEMLRLYPGCEALWIPDEQPPRALATPGLHRRLQPDRAWRDAIEVLLP